MPAPSNEMDWTDQTIATLRTLWGEGHSTAEIDRRMQTTKPAIVGKAHRLQLPARPSPIRRRSGERVASSPRPLPPVPGLARSPPNVRHARAGSALHRQALRLIDDVERCLIEGLHGSW